MYDFMSSVLIIVYQQVQHCISMQFPIGSAIYCR